MDLKKSLKNLLGMGDEDDYDDDYDDDYSSKESASVPEFEKYKNRTRHEEPSRRNLYPVSGGHPASGYNAKLIIIKPKSFDDSKNICDDMKEGKILIINTGEMDTKEAQRLLDFICGAAYNAGGDVQEVEPKVFVLSPPLVEVTRDREVSPKANFLNF